MKIELVDEPDPHDLDVNIASIRFDIYSDNSIATLSYLPPEFQLIGVGTDAVVVQHKDFPDVVYKVFGLESMEKLDLEYEAYQRLDKSPFFPTCYQKRDNYLVLSYEPGPTLYQCLEDGIIIPEQVVQDVEQAIHYAKSLDLYPQDIHLKNVILQGDRAKVIDVASYLTPGHDDRWQHLITGYNQIYPLIKGKKIPPFFIDKVKRIYLASNQKIQPVLSYISKILK